MRLTDRLGRVQVARWRVALAATLLGMAAVQTMTPAAAADPVTSAATGAAARYLNLHECGYFIPIPGVGSYLSRTRMRSSTGGTNVSNLPESGVNCNPGYVPEASGVLALDLTAGRYLNLHECAYYIPIPGVGLYLDRTVMRSSTGGTNVSNLPESGVNCNPGYIPQLSRVLALDLQR